MFGSEKTQAAAFYIILFTVIVAGLSGFAFKLGMRPKDIAIVGFIAFSLIVLLFAAAVLWRLADGSIPLGGLISEPLDKDDAIPEVDGESQPFGKASLSRFQFLIFTFVVAGLFLMLSIETGTFVEIPDNVLVLLGISGGGFIVSKAVGLPGQRTGNTEKQDMKQLKEKVKTIDEKASEALKAAQAAAPSNGKPGE